MGLSSQGPVNELARVDFMTAVAQSHNRYLDRPAPSSLADVIDTILDKGLVIDIYVRVSLVGIELLTMDARIVIASVDTYLRFAEAVNRLDLTENGSKGLPELLGDVTQGAAKRKTAGAIDAPVRVAVLPREVDAQCELQRLVAADELEECAVLAAALLLLIEQR
jgi:gas vesicle structural protein